MKKILFLLFLLPLLSQAQFPNTITSGNSSTLQKANGAFGAMLGYVFAGSYGDTTAANLSFIKNVPGIVIRNIDTLWQRNNTATKWIKIGAGSIPNLQQVTDVDSVTTHSITAPSFQNSTVTFQLLDMGGIGTLTLANTNGNDFIKPQASSLGNSFRLPNTGNPNDTIATLFDIRNGAGSTYDGDDFIINSTSAQPTSNFNISGIGKANNYFDAVNGYYIGGSERMVDVGGSLTRIKSAGGTTQFYNAANNQTVSVFDASGSNSILISQNSTLSEITANNTLKIQDNTAALELGNATGGVVLRGTINLTNAPAAYSSGGIDVIGRNQTTGDIEKATAISSITADNGLTASTSTNVQLGGTFTKKDTLNTSTTYDLTITGSTTGQVLNVYNTNVSSGVAIYAVSTAGGGIYGISSGGGEGVVAQSVSGFGVSAQSQSGVPGIFFALPSSTNTIAPVLSISRGSSGTAADGIGSSIDFYNKTSGTPGQPISNQLISKWTTSDNATRTSQFDITGVNSGTDETFMNIQHDLVRINNNADTLATKAYARSVGGAGGSGVTTMAAIGSSSNANGASISGSTLTLQPASSSFGGVVTTGTQGFQGLKTFNGGLEAYSNITLLDPNGTAATTFSTENSGPNYGGSVLIKSLNGFSNNLLSAITLGASRTNRLPNINGTLANSVTVNGNNYTSDANGVIDIGTISGGSGADALGTYIVQTATNAPANAQVLASLGTGIVKNTTTTGVLSIAVAGDFPTLNQNTTGSAATLTTTRTIWGQNFNGASNVTGDLTLGASNLTMTGSIASTGSRVTKGWFTDGEFTNMPTVGGTSLSSTFQASDADLTTWAGITPGANVGTFLATPSSANLRGALTDENGTGVALFNGATSPDFTTSVTVGSVAVPTISSTNTLTNKRITKRTGTVASSATPTINTDNVDIFTITAQTVDITSMSTNLSGTPVTGDEIDIWITGTASRAITWGASFVATSVALPTTTSGTATLKVKFTYNGSAWAIDGYR